MECIRTSSTLLRWKRPKGSLCIQLVIIIVPGGVGVSSVNLP